MKPSWLVSNASSRKPACSNQDRIAGVRSGGTRRLVHSGLQHLDARQPGRLRRLPCERDVAPVQLDQPGAHVVSARMPGQRADHVAALPGAQADQADVPGGRTVELGPQVPLHHVPPLREQGAWIVVVLMPFHPVTLAHSATLQSAAGRTQRDFGPTLSRQSPASF
jgi:hypothetical protein